MFTSAMWIVAGLLLILSEFIVPGFIIFFFGVGALFTGFLLFLFDGMPIYLQLVNFAVSSVILLLVLRRLFPGIFGGKERNNALPPDDEEYAGKMAEVLEPIVADIGGKVSFQGTEWHAVSANAHQKGDHVRIIRRENITLVVE